MSKTHFTSLDSILKGKCSSQVQLHRESKLLPQKTESKQSFNTSRKIMENSKGFEGYYLDPSRADSHKQALIVLAKHNISLKPKYT